MKFLSCCLLSGLLLAGPAMAVPASERENLALLISQLNQLNATLKRAEQQASLSPHARFFFDYRQASSDIHVMRTGVERYLTPSRAQPRMVLPLAGDYRRESVP